MRVNPNMLPDVLAGMQQSQQALNTALQQLSSGKRVALPSDDPAGSAAYVRSQADLANVDQYTRNAGSAAAEVQQADSALSAVVASLNQAVSLATQGANGTLDESNREGLATQAEGLLNSIVSQANTSFQGRSLFAGTTQPTQAFIADAASATGFTYNGNSGTNVISVGSSLQVLTNIPGDQIFTNPSANVLGSMADLVAQLKSGNSSGISKALANVTAAIGLVGQQRVVYANTANQITAQESYLSQETVTLTSQQTSLVGVDIGAAVTALTQAQVAHSAVLAAAAKVLPNTLLDYLK